MSYQKRTRHDLICDHCDQTATDKPAIPSGWAIITPPAREREGKWVSEQFHYCPKCWSTFNDIRDLFKGGFGYPHVEVQEGGKLERWYW